MKKISLFLLFTVLAGLGFSGCAAKPKPAASTAPAAGALPNVPVDATGWTTPHPPYPAEAVKAKREGSVRIRVFTDRVGNVNNTKIVQSSGHPDLDEATAKYARTNWHGPPLSRAVYVQNFALKH